MGDKETDLKIYYDATCPMCIAFKQYSEKHTDRSEMIFTDVRTIDSTDPLSKKNVRAEMYAVDSNGKSIRGSDAIFAVLRRTKKLWWLGYFGTLPVIRHMARPAYRLVARQRHYIFGSMSNIFWIRVITVIGLMAGILMSLPLWLGERFVPQAPVFLLPVPDIISSVLFFILATTLIWALCSPRPTVGLFASAAVLVTLILLDQNRFQPWVYHYGIIMILLGTYTWRLRNTVEQEKILNLLCLMIAALYFYSGLQKANPVFLSETFPWMVEPFLANDLYIVAGMIAFLIPPIEMFIGIGLLFRKTRTVAIFTAGLMLIFVLITLGPLAHGWNAVVWPWNIVSFLLVLILFQHNNKNFTELLQIPKTTVSYVIAVLFTVCPTMFFFGLWDGYPSFSLYSGQVATLHVTIAADYELPETIAHYGVNDPNGERYIDTMRLAIDDIGVPIYPETRVHTVVAQKICTVVQNHDSVRVEFRPRMHWLQPDVLPQYRCSELPM